MMNETIEEIRNWACWSKVRSVIRAAQSSFGTVLDRAYHWLEKRSDHEKITAVVASFLLLMAADLLLGLHHAWKHVFYLPIWFAAWFLPRRGAVSIATLASAWLIASPMLRGESYTVGLILGLSVALVFFHFGGLSLSYLRQVFDRESHRARFDSLSGCLNASGFYERAEAKLSELHEEFKPFAVVYLDLDNFKQLNDTFGHLQGDEALGMIGQVLREQIRSSDFVARVGGDEFVIWLNHIGPDLAFLVTRRIHEAVERASKESNWGFSSSVGCVAFSEVPESVHAALQVADECMYRAKSTGKSKIVSEMWPSQIGVSRVAPVSSISIR